MATCWRDTGRLAVLAVTLGLWELEGVSVESRISYNSQTWKQRTPWPILQCACQSLQLPSRRENTSKNVNTTITVLNFTNSASAEHHLVVRQFDDVYFILQGTNECQQFCAAMIRMDCDLLVITLKPSLQLVCQNVPSEDVDSGELERNQGPWGSRSFSVCSSSSKPADVFRQLFPMERF